LALCEFGFFFKEEKDSAAAKFFVLRLIYFKLNNQYEKF